MDAFINYVLNSQNLKNRVFVSNPPFPALLIWTNARNVTSITGISVVKQLNSEGYQGIKAEILINIIRHQIRKHVPLLYIEYHPQMEYMIIEKKRYTLNDAANYISSAFNVSIGDSPAKKPNDKEQIKDPFHIWSRDAFDGKLVTKTDIDLLIINENRISALLECKRSKKVPVGKWTPYVNPNEDNDISNYLMAMTFCEYLNTTFYTVHHDVIGQMTMNDTQKIDVFTYKPQNKLPNLDTLNKFASNNNRLITNVSNFVQSL